MSDRQPRQSDREKRPLETGGGLEDLENAAESPAAGGDARSPASPVPSGSPAVEVDAPRSSAAATTLRAEEKRDQRVVTRKGLRPVAGRTTGAAGAAVDGAAKTSKSSKKKKQQPKEEVRALELEAISPFNRGISIGVKFAALTAAVVALFMGLLGFLTYSITFREVNDQINQGGFEAVSALEKGVDRMFWVRPDAILKEIVPPLPPIEDKAAPEVKDRFAQQQASLERDRTHFYELLKKREQDELADRLNALVDQSNGQVLSAAILERQGSTLTALAISSKSVKAPEAKILSIGTVDIYEGSAVVGDRETRVRRFDKPITDAAGVNLPGQAPGATPYATVFVNAAKIDDVTERVAQRILLVTAIGALAGIILTAVIAAVLSRPIRQLEGDIAVVAEGNLDHETQPRSRDEIGALAHAFNIMTRNLKAAQQHAAERKAIERELAIATEIQTKLLPERIPQIPGLDIHSFYLSAKEVGGDYYDFIVIDQTHLGIIVADVSGKGIPGSMVMTMVRSLVRLASVRNVSPADTFKKVNRILAKDIRRGMFVTSIYMVLNVKTHELKVASAGHNPLVVFRAESGAYELVKPQGIALGFDKGTIFDNHIQEIELQLKPGDRICAYTDGVNEAMNDQSEEFGDERFYELVKHHAKLSSKDFVNAIVGELEGHRGSAEQSDDITITTLAVMK